MMTMVMDLTRKDDDEVFFTSVGKLGRLDRRESPGMMQNLKLQGCFEWRI